MRVILGRRRYIILAILGLCVVVAVGAAVHHKSKKRRHRRGETPPPVDFVRDIKPILDARCVRCHGPISPKGGLRLDTFAGIRAGGDGGAVIVPGDAANSILNTVLGQTEDLPRMPPTGERLKKDEITLIRDWIAIGAPGPADDPGPAEPAVAGHWAFQPPIAAPVPGVRRGDWAHNPVDAFLAAQHEKLGLTPSRPADPAILLRRVTLDLIGLPPTADELHAFLADGSADAYEKAVDRLLASPQYGERWARHWMDIWRYSDPDGRKSKGDIWWGNAQIWRWRDWIVRSLNADKGYDRMVVEMLAGDEVAPDDLESLAATGFLVRNWFKLDRNIWLNNTVEHTGKAFLGLTIGCARCHDHKYDPISQKEYYRFRAVFEPHDIRTDPLPCESGARVGAVAGAVAEVIAAGIARAYDGRPNEPTWIFVRGDPKTPDKTTPITPGTPAALGGPTLQVEPIQEPASTGRRLALARWICDRQNPLTARVAVNHIWTRHFGRPLVENVADFGTRSPTPAHQPLLDWLAVDLMDHGWSMKHIHRLIVTSAAYRMQSSLREASAENLAVDSDNRFYWRMNPRRMESEAVRDSLLWLGGVLDLTAGGPPLDPARGTDSARRSLYYRSSREDKMEFLVTFDAPGVEECYRRQESIIPQQALALENSAFAWYQARRIAHQLDAGRSPLAARTFVTAAFEHVLGRQPEEAEVAACEGFLVRQEKLLANPGRLTPFPAPLPPAPPDPEVLKRVIGLPLVLGVAKRLPPVTPASDPAARAREYLVHALLNHNDFITVR